MWILNGFEFPSNFAWEDKFNGVGLIEIDSFNNELVMFFMNDPSIED